jgi:hypothetical protein
VSSKVYNNSITRNCGSFLQTNGEESTLSKDEFISFPQPLAVKVIELDHQFAESASIITLSQGAL